MCLLWIYFILESPNPFPSWAQDLTSGLVVFFSLDVLLSLSSLSAYLDWAVQVALNYYESIRYLISVSIFCDVCAYLISSLSSALWTPPYVLCLRSFIVLMNREHIPPISPLSCTLQGRDLFTTPSAALKKLFSLQQSHKTQSSIPSGKWLVWKWFIPCFLRSVYTFSWKLC